MQVSAFKVTDQLYLLHVSLSFSCKVIKDWSKDGQYKTYEITTLSPWKMFDWFLSATHCYFMGFVILSYSILLIQIFCAIYLGMVKIQIKFTFLIRDRSLLLFLSDFWILICSTNSFILSIFCKNFIVY